jgi:hypothetical protein
MATIIEEINFYTILETAQALQVTPQTFKADVKKGRLIEVF